MAFTMTFDASVKVKRGAHARNLFRHIARDVDQAAGFDFPQLNVNIDSARTPLNVTVVNDGHGGFRSPASVEGRPPSDELNDYLQKRLTSVHRALRRDAVLMRPIVLQLDPAWFASNNADWRQSRLNAEARRYMGASLDWLCGEFGRTNVVGWSLHLDEYHPQLQVLMTPVTDDGRLSQKDFFKGPHDLKRQHRELREAVAASGYDVEYRVTERSREHLSSSDFQARAERLRAEAQMLADARENAEMLRMRMHARLSAVDDREAELAKREREAESLKSSSRQIQQDAQELEQSARLARATALRAREDAEMERARLEHASARLEALPPFFERWLDRSSSKGRPLRERFEADRASMRRQVFGSTYREQDLTVDGRAEPDLP
ncbi:plasmid recombination protein [Microbacterium sp. LMC-P-041]|uniref:plasmid recombination protein n=1 Tax=Microbacterium sp. LMC-P-041 TaxID=3040293 RepID=UPI002552178E|nr:plasmid recombination protein [Microbacterium sp. LMC-P-041]